MARGVNKVILLGNLGKDPDLRTTSTGVSVCSFSLATSESYKDKNGEWQENTEWHNITLWDRLAETAGKYLKKGSKVYIEGKLRTRSYEKEGSTRYITEVVALSLLMLDPKDQSSTFGQGAPANAGQQAPVQGANNFDLPKDEEDDDDIPF